MPASTPAPPLADGAPSVPTLRSLGTGSHQACAGNDDRLPPNLVDVAGAVPVENGTGSVANRRLTLDDLDAGYTITSFSASAGVIEIGTSIVNPSFTASYNRPAAVITINDGSTVQSIPPPGTSFAYGSGSLSAQTYSSNTVNATQGFTLSANETGGPPKTSSVQFQWEPKCYWGVANDPGTYNAAFATSMASSGLLPARQQTIAFNATGSEYMWYFIPVSYGGASNNFIDTGTGFAAGWDIVGTISITSATAGAPTVSFNVWRNEVAGLGNHTIQVT